MRKLWLQVGVGVALLALLLVAGARLGAWVTR